MTDTYFNFFGQPNQPPVPVLVGARGIGRRIIEIEFDLPVLIREKTQLISEPSDRYTPVTWPGASWEAANPDNYTITRPASGVLTGAGEAVELVVTHAEEAEDYATEAEYEGTTYVVAERVWLYVDYQQTPRADYDLQVSEVRAQPAGPGIFEFNDASFVGYVVSQVPRNTLTLIDQLPAVLRRQDDEGTGDLAKFFTAVQEVFDRVLEDSDAFFPELSEIDRMRTDFLDALLYDLGDPFSGLFSLTSTQKRKLAAVLVQMYREKGTCQGVVNVVRFFTGIQLVGCTTSLDGNWRLHGGSYPSTTVPPGGPYQLDTETAKLGPGTGEELRSFSLLHATPGSLTADELETIEKIVDYMKPASSRYLGVKAP